jgi:hypothetical protein
MPTHEDDEKEGVEDGISWNIVEYHGISYIVRKSRWQLRKRAAVRLLDRNL